MNGHDCISVKQFTELGIQCQLGQMEQYVWRPGDNENIPCSRNRKKFNEVEGRVEKRWRPLAFSNIIRGLQFHPWCLHSANSTLFFIFLLQLIYSVLIGQAPNSCCTVRITYVIMAQSPKRWESTWHLFIKYLLSPYYVPGSVPDTWSHGDKQKEFSLMQLII